MIYFLRDPVDGLIKIGTTVRLSTRKKQLERKHETTLDVLGVMSGGYLEEKELHSLFAASSEGGEWFHPSEALAVFIADHAEPWNKSSEVAPKPIGLDFDPVNHERLERHATKRGLSMAAFVRMFILEKLDELDSGR